MAAPVPPNLGNREPESEPEEQIVFSDLDVVCWRMEELQRAGYPPLTAIRLAERSQIDLHEACDLLSRGATAEQAVRILL